MVIQCGWMTIDSISVINGKATTPAEIVRRIGMVRLYNAINKRWIHLFSQIFSGVFESKEVGSAQVFNLYAKMFLVGRYIL